VNDMRNTFPNNFNTWPLEKQRSYVRHPQHLMRCACKRYGLFPLEIRDDWGVHGEHRCQPDREVID